MAKAKTVTIELPETVEFETREREFTFEFSKVDVDLAEFVVDAMIAGITKAGIDSGSGAKAYAEKHELTIDQATDELVDKWISARYKSGWSRAAGEGLSAVDRKMISLVRPAVKAQDEKAYKNAEESKRVEMCMEYLKGLKDAQFNGLREHAEKEIERAKARADAIADILGNVEV